MAEPFVDARGHNPSSPPRLPRSLGRSTHYELPDTVGVYDVPDPQLPQHPYRATATPAPPYIYSHYDDVGTKLETSKSLAELPVGLRTVPSTRLVENLNDLPSQTVPLASEPPRRPLVSHQVQAGTALSSPPPLPGAYLPDHRAPLAAGLRSPRVLGARDQNIQTVEDRAAQTTAPAFAPAWSPSPRVQKNLRYRAVSGPVSARRYADAHIDTHDVGQPPQVPSPPRIQQRTVATETVPALTRRDEAAEAHTEPARIPEFQPPPHPQHNRPARTAPVWERPALHASLQKLTIELPVPPKLAAHLPDPSTFGAPVATRHHFSTVQYSAITCDPAPSESFQQVYPRSHYESHRTEEGASLNGRATNSQIWDAGFARCDFEGEGSDRPKIELCIAVTIYNERSDSLVKTFDALWKNIAFLCHSRSRGRSGVSRTHASLSRMAGIRESHRLRSDIPWHSRTKEAMEGWFYPTAWQKVVVVVVLDGLAAANPRVLDNLEAMGIFQPAAMQEVDDFGNTTLREKVGKDDIQAHLFESTVTLPSPDVRARGTTSVPKPIPVQMILLLKPKNLRKINSHRWFFSLCAILQPRTTALLDVGTVPNKDALFQLWRPLYLFPSVAGSCGEIKVSKGDLYLDLLKSPLIASQNFEYKISCILDKRLESVCGFVSVLPGAFSAFRYSALLDDPATGEGPLASYFLGEPGERHLTLDRYDAFAARDAAKRRWLSTASTAILRRNMYLAEDRILCWELVSKRAEANTLYYNARAVAETDPVETLEEFILQRRRWLNGAFASSVISIAYGFQIYRSRHSFFRMIILHLQWLYNLFNLGLAWMTPANFYISYCFVTNAFMERISMSKGYAGGDAGSYPGIWFPTRLSQWIYIATLFVTLIVSLGNKPNGVSSRWFFMAACVFFAILVLYMIAVSLYLIYVSFDLVSRQPGGLTLSGLFHDCNLSKIFLAVCGTYGLWFLASLIALQPWHIFTSLVQYICMSPTYINLLNTYAFCNTHDLSWGTKGATTDTESGPRGDGAQKAGFTFRSPTSTGLHLPRVQQVEMSYQQAVERLQTEVFAADKKERKLEALALANMARREQLEHEKTLDYYMSFRTMLILIWGGSNILLAAVVLWVQAGRDLFSGALKEQPDSICDKRGANYMSFLVYSIAATSSIKFVGLLIYQVQTLVLA